MSSLNDTNTNGRTMQFVASDRPIPGITTKLASQRAVWTPKLSQNTTSIANSKMLHGPPGTTTTLHRISFVSRRLIYSTNSARSYTSLGRIPCTDLGTRDFQTVSPPFSFWWKIDRSVSRCRISQDNKVKILKNLFKIFFFIYLFISDFIQDFLLYLFIPDFIFYLFIQDFIEHFLLYLFT